MRLTRNDVYDLRAGDLIRDNDGTLYEIQDEYNCVSDSISAKEITIDENDDMIYEIGRTLLKMSDLHRFEAI